MVAGTIGGLEEWLSDVLGDPARWGLGAFDFTNVIVEAALHPMLPSYSLNEGGVYFASPSALLSQTALLLGADAASYADPSTQVLVFWAGTTGVNPNATSTFLNFVSGVLTDGAAQIGRAIPADTMTLIVGEDIWNLSTPFSLTLGIFIVLRVSSQTDRSDERGLILPCAVTGASTGTTGTTASTLTPAPVVTCAPAPPPAGGTARCTVSGAPPEFDILWRAATNPAFAQGVVTTGTDGTGTFGVMVPRDAAGRTLTVELVAWTTPLEVGVVSGPVPGGGPRRARTIEQPAS